MRVYIVITVLALNAIILCGQQTTAMLLTVGVIAPQSTPSQSSSPPLSVSDIEHGLKAGVTNTRMAALVKRYGADFELTDAVEKQLRAAGANSDLLIVVSRTRRSAKQTQTTGTDESGSSGSQSGTLPATLKLIQDTLNSMGRIVFVEYVRSNADGSTGSHTYGEAIKEASGNPQSCVLTFSRTSAGFVDNAPQSAIEEFPTTSMPWWVHHLPLKDVVNISVLSQLERRVRLYQAANSNVLPVRIVPSIFSLEITSRESIPTEAINSTARTVDSSAKENTITIKTIELSFADGESAHTVANSMSRAVKFCGGTIDDNR